MTLREKGRRLRASLRLRLVMLTLLAFAAVSIPAFLSFNFIVNSAVIRLGTLFAEKQILFDRYRGLSALMQEVSLAETLARAPAIRDWALDEADPDKKRRGIGELEHYRRAFTDGSYFFVVGASGNYYYNDHANAYAGDQFRYTIEASNPRDAWYYRTAGLGDGCHLNVDNDENLRVTKVWINCVIREGKKVLGVLGTGIDLTAFIREVVDIPQTGVTAMFVDRTGALQAHRDPRLVDFHSISKDPASRKTVYAMLDRPVDRDRLAEMLAVVAENGDTVRSAFMQVDGRQMLVGAGYLDRLGWYNVTFMDIDKIIDRGLFLPVGLLLGAMVALALVLIGWMFRRQVVDRLDRLGKAVTRIEAGDYAVRDDLADTSGDEIGRLSRAFVQMAETVGQHTATLEARVRARTHELEALAFRDQLTGIANRRGFAEAYADRAPDGPAGLLLIDIDRFKAINDTYGHQAGDEVVTETARRLSAALGKGEFCARWGGDEFIVLAVDQDAAGLEGRAERLVTALAGAPIRLADGREIVVSLSIGGCPAGPDNGLAQVLDLADAALYTAKDSGRGRVVVCGPMQNLSQTA